MVKIEEIHSLEDIRNRLISACTAEPAEQRSGYINGILDMYNESKKRQALLLEMNIKESENEHISSAK